MKCLTFKEKWGINTFVLLCSLALLIIVPLVTEDKFLLHVIILANVYVVLSAAWDICSGYLGEVNLGHAAFFGLGAYTVAYFDQWFKLSPWIGIFMAGGVSCVFSLFIGFTSLTLKRDYFVIVSIAFAQILWSVASTWASLTGGEEGIRHISNFSSKVILNYFLALGLMAVSIAILYRLVKSRLGRILLAIHEDEYAAKAAGLNTSLYKILTFTISSFFAGLIGGFYAYYLGIVTPESLSLGVTFNVMAMTFVGGSTTIFGPILGAYIITFLAQYLYFFMEYRLITQSLALLLIVVFFPGGLIRLIFKSAYR
jgi:branched-chain amino acid transport system permease protein